MELDHLEITVLLRVLLDSRVEAVAVEHYAVAELQKLIDQLSASATKRLP
jgi:hypothetical protein